MLLDVSRLDHATIDTEKGLAVVGPGKGGSLLMADLEAQGLFFPGGHCKGVCLGGYLLQGGYGWNSRVYGPACESVIGLDVITADGEQIHCDEDNHADLYWAARGAGPGFFGVVTSFYLKLYPRPAVCGTSVYIYPFDLADEVFTWARARQRRSRPSGRAAGRRLPRRPEDGHRRPGIIVRLAGVRRLRRGGRKGPGPVRHLPGRRQGDRQSPLYANRFAHLV